MGQQDQCIRKSGRAPKTTRPDGTPVVALEKGDLAVDGVIEDGEIPEDQEMHVQRLGKGGYLVRAVEDGEILDVDELLRAEGR